MAVCLLGLSACNTKQDFIQGTYVKSDKSEYGIARDTLIIMQTDGNNYLIDFHVSYQAVRNGKVLLPHHRNDKFSASWDPSKEQLNETVSGRIYTFQPDKNTMMLNAGVFYKIK